MLHRRRPTGTSGPLLLRYKLLVLTGSLFMLFAVIAIGAASRHEIPANFKNVVSIGGHCSGFIMPSNLVITARHCVSEEIESGGTVTVIFYDGLSSEFSLLTYGQEEDSRDFAVLRGDTRGFQPWKFSTTIPDKDTVCGHVGYGGASPRQLGVVCRVIGLNKRSGYIELSGAAIGGDSGSALFELETGEVFGIIVRSSYPVPTALAVPLANALNAIKKVLKDEARIY